MFRVSHVNIDNLDLYMRLKQSTTFEHITRGRQGAILVDPVDGHVPIVRTTTAYEQQAQKFSPIHYEIIASIRAQFADIPQLTFNNAMIEIYDSSYRKMRFHTDQALDLEDDSFICLFSCYKNADTAHFRTLKIKNKSSQECWSIDLTHNSAVLFSTRANSEHVHKIVLDSNNDCGDWLGITFRLSKTYIDYTDHVPTIVGIGKLLRMATSDEVDEFRKHKSLENKTIGKYSYPDIGYTISMSDKLQMRD